jgi:hypothetical protein
MTVADFRGVGFLLNNSGGAILVHDANLTLNNLFITGNSATSSGGGLSNPGGTVTVVNTAIANNTSELFGGGIWYQLKNSQGFGAVQFGANGDRPIPNAFVS